jgi:hypothetical protein
MAKKKTGKRKKSKKGDRLPDLPGPDILYTGGRYSAAGLLAAAAVNPYVAAAIGTGLGTYALMENTERFWGPRVEAHAQRTRDRFRKDTSTAIDPDSAWDIPEGWGYQAKGPIGPPEPMTTKRTRKVTKANKATKMAWDILRKRMKGKMTKENCQKLLKKCSMMASKANPNTKSKIGKGKTQTCKDCKKIRKTIWGTTKRN